MGAAERVLGAGLLVVTRLLLPLTSPDFANASNDSISRSTTATSGLRGLDRWHNDLRASAGGSVVQRTIVVGTVSGDPTDLAWHAIHKIHAKRRLDGEVGVLALPSTTPRDLVLGRRRYGVGEAPFRQHV